MARFRPPAPLRRAILRLIPAFGTLALTAAPLWRMASAAAPRPTEIWRCGASECPGYEYDPMQGDPDTGIAPGTAFRDLPEDWACPRCGAGKSEFRRLPETAIKN